MTKQRLLILSILWLLTLGSDWNLNAAPSRPARDGEGPQSTGSTNAGQSDMPLSIAANRGALQLKAGAGAVVSNMRIRLRHSDNSSSTLYELEFARQDAGDDKAGRFESFQYHLKPAATAPGTSPAPQLQATLELRRYLRPEILIATLDYEGPALAARDGVQLVMGLDNFARGMALKRFKLYWTAPVFISDHRLLSPANVLLLWRQTVGDNYHMMLPLAGGGMVSEVGVSEIEYRPEFRISASSHDPRFSPRRVPLFAYATARDPYQLPRDAYQTAFAATEQYGQLRWQKTLPEAFGWLGWCSWNAYQQTVNEEKILASARSLRDRQIPIGFMLIDDGWLTIKGQKLAGFDADPAKFPRGLGATARALREQYHIRHVGVWHTFQGYWTGVDTESPLARDYQLFRGREGNALPDPREGRGESFYADWYAKLKEWGFDFVKVDGQANNIKFTDGLMPLFVSAGGSQRNLQEAAQKHFKYGGDEQRAQGVGVINCMEMTLENAYNWRTSNVARNSDDYLPEVPHNFKDHIFQNAYNSYWMSNFAYPDWDMFQSHDANGGYHAVARAVSGGPIYFTDEPGKEKAEILRPLAFSDGRLLLLDEPGQVTRDLLFTDASIEAAPLKVFGRITRPGLTAGMVAAFNANKSAPLVTGKLRRTDAEGLIGSEPNASTRVAVYRRSDGGVSVLSSANPTLPLSLAKRGFELFTLSPVKGGIAVFGLLDKYLGPAAIVSARRQGGQVEVRLREAGDFGAWLEQPPAKLELDGRTLPPSAYSYRRGLLHIPRASFSAGVSERQLRIQLAPRR